MVYILEPNGKTNTAKYVSNLLSGEDKVFTSNKSNYPKNNEIPVFKKYRDNYGLKKLWNYILGWLFIVTTIKKGDVLHFHWLKASPIDYFFLMILKIRLIKIVGTVHNILPHEERAIDCFFYRRIYNLTDELIFHTEGILKKFTLLFNRPNASTIINHYFDPVHIDVHSEVANQLLFFGNIRPYKGLELLVEAVLNISEHYKWNLLVAGQLEYDISEIRNRTANNKSIIWSTNFIEDQEVEDLFNTYGIVVMPYEKIDTSGLLYLAKSYGKVIIAPRMGIFEESISHEENGLLFKPNNSDDLRKKIEYALDQNNHSRMKEQIISELPADSVGEFRSSHQDLYQALKKGK